MTDEERKERQREYGREYYQKNKEKITESRRISRLKNPEKTREVGRKAAAKHRLNNYERVCESQRVYRTNNPFKIKLNTFVKDGGPRYEDEDVARGVAFDIYTRQDGKCAISGVPLGEFGPSISLDHCHKTGEVRGYLLNQMNLAFGSIEVLAKEHNIPAATIIEGLAEYNKKAEEIVKRKLDYQPDATPCG